MGGDAARSTGRASGKIPGFRRASVKEVRELSKLPWVRDDSLSTGSSEARVLPDGRVLLFVVDGAAAALYPSRESLAEVVRQCEAMPKGPVDRTLTLLPPIADFIRDVEAHAKSLGPRLRIPDEALDRSIESLDAVDGALRRIPWAKRQLPDLVTPLVAYVGEVVRAASGGQWTPPKQETRLRKHADGTFTREPIPLPPAGTEPLITAGNGRILQPFALVFIPMVEPSKRIPLRSAVETILSVNGYRAAPKPAE